MYTLNRSRDDTHDSLNNNSSPRLTAPQEQNNLAKQPPKAIIIRIILAFGANRILIPAVDADIQPRDLYADIHALFVEIRRRLSSVGNFGGRYLQALLPDLGERLGEEH